MASYQVARWSALLLNLLTVVSASDGAPWRKYIQSPASRTILPQSVYHVSANSIDITDPGRNGPQDIFRLSGPNASVTFDFGKRIAGYPTIAYGNVNCLGVAFTELEDFIGPQSDHGVLFSRDNGTLFVPVNRNQNYTIPTAYSRGSFRYLTLSLGPTAQSGLSVDVQLRSVHFDAAPNLAEEDLQNYTGYFHSSDDLLNRMWYAGAYTSQLCTIGANSSVQHTRILSSGWSNDASVDGLSGSDMFLADGAKRDRNPWAGDLDVSLKSALTSVNYDNLISVKNTLIGCLVLQDVSSGFFPYAGSPLGDLLKLAGSFVSIQPYGSDTYHLWTISNFADYVLASGDTAFGIKYWGQIAKGIQATYSYVDASDGLYNGTKTADWARIGQGGKNIALNSIYYHALLSSARMATYLSSNNTKSASEYQQRAARVKQSVNNLLWDPSAGLYFDNTTSSGRHLYPSDGNVAAINFNLTTSLTQSLIIAQNLAKRLARFGSTPPELPNGISPFVSSQELRAQFSASPNNPSRALDLVRTQWCYMLKAFGNSTLIEGYNANGSIDYPFYAGDPSFVSAAHAWSTGPTYSLLASVVGLRASHFDVGPGEGDWAFQPCVNGSGLSYARGGFKVRSGEFNASWNITGKSFRANLTTPAGLSGTIYVPALTSMKAIHLLVDGKPRSDAVYEDGFLRLPGVNGGVHSIATF